MPGARCRAFVAPDLASCEAGGSLRCVYQREFFFSELFPALQDFALEREDVHSIPTADVLTQPAGSARFLVHNAHPEEVVDAFGMLQRQRVERADGNAEFAARTNALVFDDDCPGPVGLLDGATDLSQRVQDRLRRTDYSTGAAVDTKR